jgi:hypothetical protein
MHPRHHTKGQDPAEPALMPLTLAVVRQIQRQESSCAIPTTR